ncbi:hypothetical protein Tco_1316658 [Tanacetum coccineum]
MAIHAKFLINIMDISNLGLTVCHPNGTQDLITTPAPVKAVEESCVTCGGAHSWYNCPSTDNNQSSVCATTGTYNQVAPPNRISNQIPPPGFAPVQNNGQNRNGYLRKGRKTKPKRQNRTRNEKACTGNLGYKLAATSRVPASLSLLVCHLHQQWKLRLDVPTRQILDSRGAVPTKTAADAKTAIQEMA